ncbi:MAG TPA: hypothetical protein VHA12_00285 [Candidatus Nanoarchaeia archaeon]|nr:hypothetical protein [Candidatus Nanoarchaeia archaeon]
MSYAYLVPQWFFGASIFLEILFSLAALFVAIYAYRVSRIYNQKSIILMTLGFSFIAVSYLSKALINIFLLKQIQSGVLALSIGELNRVAAFGLQLYIGLYLIGALLLLYMTFKSDSTDLFLVLLALSSLGIWFSPDNLFAFNVIVSLLFCAISLYYGKEYLKNKNKRTMLIFLGFLGLLLSGIGFTFATGYYMNYVIAHVLELASYGLILASIFSLIVNKK